MTPYDRDRLLAIKDVLSEASVEPFDIRDAKQCAYRVLTDIVARDRVDETFGEAEFDAYARILERLVEIDSDGLIHRRLFDEARHLLDHRDTSSLAKMRALISGLLAAGAGARAGLHKQAAELHFSAIETLERQYRLLVAERPEEGNDAVQSLPVDFAELGAVLTSHMGEPVTITAGKLSPGGYSKLTIFCELRASGTILPVVVRCDEGAGIAGTSVLDEYPVIAALHSAGIAVPRPIWAGRLGARDGGIMVVESVEGIAFGSPISSVLQDDELCRALGRHIAGLHKVPVSLLDGILEVRSAQEQILSAIAVSERNLAATGVGSPLHAYAFQWLKDHIHHVQDHGCIVHGDYGPHNLLVANSDVNAILDWELVKIGHPGEDLCWPRLAIEALGSWDIFLGAYEASGGVRPSLDELNFFSILSLARVSVMQMQIDLGFGSGAATPVRWAAPGVERLRPTMLRLGAMLGLAAAHEPDVREMGA